MNHLTLDNVHTLIDNTLTPCVSIYLPTEKAGKDVLQGKIRLKNLLRDSEGLLEAHEISDKDIQNLLAPAYALVDDSLFWQNCDESLAIFISEKYFQYFKLPMTFEKKVAVGEQFQIIPLLAVLTNSDDFYILSLSQKQIRLFQCNTFDMEEIHLKDMPTNLEDALQIDTPDRQLQSHSGSTGASQAIFHGHGGGSEDNKQKIYRFMQKISDDILSYMPYKDLPLVTAGVSYINAIYSETNKYPYLLKDSIEGGPDNLQTKTLWEKGHQIVSLHRNKKISSILERFHNVKNTGSGSEIASDIVSASFEGRVSDLILTANAELWGQYDPATQKMIIEEKHLTESQDLFNLAAMHTLKNNGNVMVVPSELLPEPYVHIGLFRY